MRKLTSLMFLSLFVFLLIGCEEQEPTGIDVEENLGTSYDVTYIDMDGSIIASYEVMQGDPAPVPDAPVKEGYVFEGWSQEVSNISKNEEIFANYSQIFFNVTYFDYDNSEIASFEVPYGESAPEPDDPVRNDYIFEGWDQSIDNIQSDLQIKAKYAPIVLQSSPSEELLNADACRIQNQQSMYPPSPGFPISPFMLPSLGTLNIKIIAADFLDYQGGYSQQDLIEIVENYMYDIEHFFYTQSYGKVDFRLEYSANSVLIPERAENLSLSNRNGARDIRSVFNEAVELADSTTDFTDTDLIIVVLNPEVPLDIADVSTRAIQGRFEYIQTDEAYITNGLFLSGVSEKYGISYVTFELGRMFGLAQLSRLSWLVENNQSQFQYTGIYDFMSYETPYDSRYGDNREMLGWQRYLLGWMNEENIRCVNPNVPSETIHELSPIHLDDGKAKMIVLPYNSHQSLVIEMKSENEFCAVCEGGIYTYLVDTNYGSGHGPIRIIRPNHSRDRLLKDAFISLGETLIYHDVRIEFIENHGNHVVRVHVVDDPSEFYMGNELSGITAFVDDEFDSRLLTHNSNLDIDVFLENENLENLYLSEEIYAFLGDSVPRFLNMYEDEIMSLQGEVLVTRNAIGQKLIIGRAMDAFGDEYYRAFIDALSEGISESRSIIRTKPADFSDFHNKEVSPNVCYIRDLRGPSYPSQEPQSTTVSHDIPVRRVASDSEIVGLNILIGFNEIPEMVSYEEFKMAVSQGLDVSDQFFAQMSNGQISFEWRFHEEILYIPFFLEPGMGPGSPDFEKSIGEAIEDVFDIAEEKTDFSDVDIVQIFWPIGTPNYVYGGLEILTYDRVDTERGNIYNYNVKKMEMRYLEDVATFGRHIYHGILHNLGLTDIYIFNFSPEWAGYPTTYKYGNFDPMTSADSDLSAWHRWILSWLPDDQVHCVPETEDQTFEIYLNPLNDIDSETRMIVIPLSETEALSIELRDPNQFCEENFSTRFSMPRVGGCTQNVLVTHIDSSIGNGHGPMTILRTERSNAEDYSDALMQVGESVTFEDITITHTERYALGSVITIEFKD